MNTLPAPRAPLPVLTEEVLAAVGRLHPDTAQSLLVPLWKAARPGLGRRALLAARITLMRRAMAAEPLVVMVAEPLPEPEPEPEPVFVPVPPKALAKGALTLLNLEDAARLLMASGDGDDDAKAEAPAADAARDAALADVAEAVVVDASMARVEPAPLADLSASFAAMADVGADDGFTAGLALLDALGDGAGGGEGDAFSAEDGSSDLGGLMAMAAAPALDKATKADIPDKKADKPAKARPAKPKIAPKKLADDLTAQLAELGPASAPTPAPAQKAPVIDLSAQFAAMGGGDPAATVPELPAAKTKAKATVIDLSAQFAAMDDD